MAKLRQELDSHHRSSEQPSAEQMNKDDDKAHELHSLVISTMQLKVKLQEVENQKHREEIQLHRAKQTVEKVNVSTE